MDETLDPSQYDPNFVAAEQTGLQQKKRLLEKALAAASGAVTNVVTPGAAAAAPRRATPAPQSVLPQALAASGGIPALPNVEDPVALYRQAETKRNAGYEHLMPSEAELGAGRMNSMLGQVAAMGMGLMGPGMAENREPMLKQALAEEAKFTLDPYKRRELEARKFEAAAGTLEKRAALAQAMKEKQWELATKLASELESKRERNQMMGMIAGMAAGNRSDAAQAKLDQNLTTRASALRNDFDPLVKDLRMSIQTFPQIEAALIAKTPTPASDMRAIFRYMKMLDPTSVVREGEYATAKNARGIPDKVMNAYNSAMNGLILTPKQRQDFLSQAKSEADTAQQSFNTHAKRFHEIAKRQGVDPRDVTPGYDFEAGKPTGEIDVTEALKSGKVPGRRSTDYRDSTL